MRLTARSEHGEIRDVTADARSDLIVVGAGIVGLAHAVEAATTGAVVTVVERDERPVGASICNFGHICVTAQAGPALGYAELARERWIALGESAGFRVQRSGTVAVARARDELDVLAELAEERGGAVVLLDEDEVRRRVPGTGAGVVGGALMTADLRVDPTEAIPALARWAADQPGVSIRWSTNVTGIEPGSVRTSRGLLRADHVVVCVNHDLDRLYPEIAEEAAIERCGLQMLAVEAPNGARYDSAVFTATSLLRYSGFARCPSIARVRDRLEADHAELVAAGVNLMFTQRPDGTLILGDTHRYAKTLDPFGDEHLDRLVLAEAALLLGADELKVRRRWQGVYASGPGEFLVASPLDGVRAVSVTAGIGMTTAFGLAKAVLDDLLGS